jgi:hypothetical protein
MNFTKVKNPTDIEVALQFRGEKYVLGPNETKSFPIAVAKQWIIIYQFMTFEGDDAVGIATPVVEVTETKEVEPVKEVKEIKKKPEAKKK